MSEVLDILNAYNVDIDYDIFRVTPIDYDKDKYMRKQRVETGRTLNLYRSMSEANAPEEDLFSAWCYLKVCVDAVKHGLDMKKARMTFGIKELTNKYTK